MNDIRLKITKKQKGCIKIILGKGLSQPNGVSANSCLLSLILNKIKQVLSDSLTQEHNCYSKLERIGNPRREFHVAIKNRIIHKSTTPLFEQRILLAVSTK